MGNKLKNRMEVSLKSSSPFWLMIIILTFGLASCGSGVSGCMDQACGNYNENATEDDGSCNCNSTVDYSESMMLNNYANNIIVSAYSRLSSSVDSIAMGLEANDMDAARLALKNSYVAWQYCSVFEFGPAENYALRSAFNTYPTDTAMIQSFIESGSYNLNAASSFGAKGFPALDYLLFSNDTLTTASMDLAKALAWDIIDHTNYVLQAWNNEYAAEFVSKTGTSIASAIGLMVNQLNYEVDLLKGAKVGIPLGKKTLGTPMVDQVEAYFSGHTNATLLANVRSLENVFKGGNSQGLSVYLDFVKAKSIEGEDLSTAIEAKFDEIETAILALNYTLAEAIIEEEDKVDTIHDLLVDLILMTKTDMPAALGVLISYQDNDGD